MWHFEYTLDLDEKNRLIYGKIYGVWKQGTGESYADELKKLAQPLVKKPWAKIIDLSNWKTAYPEVFTIIGDLNRWCKKHNLEWTIYVVNQSVQYAQIMKMMNTGNYNSFGRTARTMAEAQKFLMEKGYTIKKESDGIFK